MDEEGRWVGGGKKRVKKLGWVQVKPYESMWTGCGPDSLSLRVCSLSLSPSLSLFWQMKIANRDERSKRRMRRRNDETRNVLCVQTNSLASGFKLQTQTQREKRRKSKREWVTDFNFHCDYHVCTHTLKEQNRILSRLFSLFLSLSWNMAWLSCRVKDAPFILALILPCIKTFTQEHSR